jgi:TATA-binding protein-associated factor Taf7
MTDNNNGVPTPSSSAAAIDIVRVTSGIISDQLLHRDNDEQQHSSSSSYSLSPLPATKIHWEERIVENSIELMSSRAAGGVTLPQTLFSLSNIHNAAKNNNSNDNNNNDTAMGDEDDEDDDEDINGCYNNNDNNNNKHHDHNRHHIGHNRSCSSPPPITAAASASHYSFDSL